MSDEMSAELRFAIHGEQMFGLRVRHEREARFWSQRELAQRMTAAGFSMHQSTINKLETGGRPTSVREVFGFAALFELPSTALVGGGDDAGLLVRQADARAAMLAYHDAHVAVQGVLDELQARIDESQILYQRARDRVRRAQEGGNDGDGSSPDVQDVQEGSEDG